MALELNKKKYLVLCVMLILLNHHINGAIGADSKDSKKEAKTDEPQAPESGAKAEAPENGSKAHTSRISNSGPITPEILKSRSKAVDPGSKAEAPENGSKAPTSRISNSGPITPDVLKSGSKAEAPENGSKAPTSRISNSGPINPDVLKSGSKAEAPENGSKAPTSRISNSGPITPDVLKSGSKAEAPENGSKAPEPQVSNSASKNPDSQVSKAEPPSKASIYQVSNGGPKTPAAEAPSPNAGSLAMSPEGSQTNSATKGAEPLKLIKIPENGTKPGPPQVPCYFIFGDSLVDAGNNNILETLARADYEPYGMDFKPQPGPTGRFSNGRTTVDVITELLGFDHYMPPSERTNGTDILQGLNFASAAAGIREETAQHLGDRITMREQVENFRAKVGEMAKLLGGQKNTTDYLGKCLYSVGLGSNDYLNNYFIPNLYPTSKLLTPEQYADDLVNQYTTHLMAIYDLGARKFALNGVSQVGCSPNSLAQFSPDGTCVKRINDANEMFNSRLKTLVDTLNKDHPDAKFTYVNAYGFFQELKEKAATYGFKDTSDGCCGIGKNNGLITCLPGLSPCPNRNEYIFWDAYHPTEATNIIGAKRSYQKQLPTDAYPYDIHTLVTLK